MEPNRNVNSNGEDYRNVMVNFLPPFVDDGILRHLFEKYGEIESVKIVSDAKTQESKCFGFVKFVDVAGAQNAMQHAQGMQLQGKMLKLHFAKDGDRRKSMPSQVYVAGFGQNVSMEALQQFFSQFGEVTSIKSISSKSEAHKGVCFVDFDNYTQAMKAVKMANGHNFCGDVLTVRISNHHQERLQPHHRANYQHQQQYYQNQHQQHGQGEPRGYYDGGRGGIARSVQPNAAKQYQQQPQQWNSAPKYN